MLTKLVIMTLALVTMSASAADFSSWNKRMSFTFSGYSRTATLTNFPALVVLSTNLAGFSYVDFPAGTNVDLRFTDSTLTNELNYEVDEWNTNGNSYVWVQVPRLATNKAIWAFWGKTGQSLPAYTTNGAAWSNGYLSVYHLNGSGSTVGLRNSAAATNNLTNGGAASNTPSGFIGNGVKFDGGTNDGHYLTVSKYVGFPATNQPFTLSTWVNMTVSNSGWRGILCVNETNATTRAQVLIRDNATGKFCVDSYYPGDSLIYADNLYSTGRWYYVAMIFDGTTEYISVDGTLQNGGVGLACTQNYDVTQQELDIARQYSARSPCNTTKCLQDEVRVSTVARSTDWTWAEWMNMTSNNLFATNGPILLSTQPVIQNVGVSSLTPGSATISGYLNSTGTADTTVFLYWGPSDGGTNAASWARTNQFTALWPAQIGALSTNISWSVSNITYYYRYCATNANGVSWAGPTLSFVAPAAPADFSSWTNAMSFRFTGYTPPGGATTLTNFPALVILSTNLSGFRYTDFNGANTDLRFTDATTTNELNYQVEKWDTTGNSYVWVQVPRLTDSNTQICAFWGKSGQAVPAYTTNGATWSNGYVAVWHMSETNAQDSTSNRYHCTSISNQNAQGLADGAQSFTNSNTYMTAGPSISNNSLTIEGWVKHNTLSASIQRYLSMGPGDAPVIRHEGNGTLNFYFFDTNSAIHSLQVGSALTVGAWYYVAGTYDGTSMQLFLNGSPIAGNAVTAVVKPRSFAIFSAASSTEYLDGLLDELRLSSLARSSNWVWACWMNMASNSAFVAHGALQKLPRPVNVTYPSEGVTNDRFDVSQGAKVFAFSAPLTNATLISDPRDILGSTRSTLEAAGRTLFADGGSVGKTVSVSFRIASHINLTNYQLRVTSDGLTTSNRTIGGFALYGSADNMTYALIDSTPVAVPYNMIPGVTDAAIMISRTVTTPAYQFFRLDINHGFTDGPRVIELDGFGTPALFAGTVLDPIAFNSTLNAASINTYLDEDPGYATNIQTSPLQASYTVNTDGKYALGAASAPEANNLLFKDTSNTPDNGDLIFNNGGETIHWISWGTTQPLTLAGINLGITYPDRPAKLIRFSVNGVAQVFKNSGSPVYNVGGINSASTNFLFANPVSGTSFKLELTGGTNSDGNAYGPRLGEINALLYFEPQGTIYTLR